MLYTKNNIESITNSGSSMTNVIENKKEKNKHWVMVVLILLFFLTLGLGIGAYLWQNKKLEEGKASCVTKEQEKDSEISRLNSEIVQLKNEIQSLKCAFIETCGSSDIKPDPKKERDSQRKSAMADVQLALELYADDTKSLYPPNSAQKDDLKTNYSNLVNYIIPKYLISLPSDPTNTSPYIFEYKVNDSLTDYELNIVLESDSDDADENDGGNENDIYEVGTDLNIISNSDH